MTLQITAAHNDARLSGTLAFLDEGPGNARLRIYAGARPANPEDEPAAAHLVEIPLTKPAGVVSGGALALTQSENGLISATGVATWARAVNGDGVTAFDADAGQGAGAWEVQLSQAQLFSGGEVQLLSAVLG